MAKIRLFLKERSYDIIVREGALADCGKVAARLGLGTDAVVVSNKTVWALHGSRLRRALKRAGFKIHLELVPDSERAKSIASLARLLRNISLFDKRKRPFIVAFGGGVVGDLAGFTAAIYKRGVPYIQVPTTLLAQVDAAIGGKTAVDLPVAKNLAGAFYQPRAVISDTSVLKTLPARHMRNGLAEIIKYGVISDRRLFSYLEKNHAKVLKGDRNALAFAVTRSSAIKAAYVEKDEYDSQGVRAALNYGHTIGHAIEAASGYSSRYYHGEAVAAGMVVAARLAVMLRSMKRSDSTRVERLIRACSLPARIRGLSYARLYRAYVRDKKFIHGKNRFVLPARIGAVRIAEGVSDNVVKEAIASCSAR
ncbi:MAG: 3-dehydroquinate synthase [Candidatus Omnitrophica bacterium]|nr:3-dehydroquinate synthase [Candidatus Omnitrophota bacterium]